MSALTIIGLIWLGFASITVEIAARNKLPLILWVPAAVLLGPLAVFSLGAAIASKRRLPSYDDGSSPYGGGAFLG